MQIGESILVPLPTVLRRRPGAARVKTRIVVVGKVLARTLSCRKARIRPQVLVFIVDHFPLWGIRS